MIHPRVFTGKSVHVVVTSGLFSILLFLNACTSFPLVDTHNYLTPVPEKTLQAYELNQPLDNRLKAVMAAHYALQTTRINPVQEPGVIYAELMTYREVLDRIEQEGAGGNIANSKLRTKVWLVVYRGKWRLLAPTGDYTESQDACAFAVVKAENGDSVWMGLLGCEKIDLNPQRV